MPKNLTLIVVSMLFAAGCSTMHSATQSQRAAIEQLLISEAVLRSLPQDSDGILSIPQGARVVIDTSGISADQILLQRTLGGWLGQQGYAVQKNEDKADYRVSVIVGALGTELGNSFFGMPPVTSQLIPFSLPELALYKAQYQTGYVKFHMDIFELPGGTFVQSTPPFLAETHFNNHTVLLFFTINSTDLESAPRLGSVRSSAGKRSQQKNGQKYDLGW
ncbi:hypothetical protein SAMN05216387_102199 [Nitrosovibrio tenuis]|uniref:Uncharacterized protein n=2 Tax=Nitrosovibrio tenuis TaxID=1233 RepID=A0A1H7IK38_9PROT|nr:hypothetical protein SAMN05216387_102199 [Nitrosovibrio tenuis]